MALPVIAVTAADPTVRARVGVLFDDWSTLQPNRSTRQGRMFSRRKTRASRQGLAPPAGPTTGVCA